MASGVVNKKNQIRPFGLLQSVESIQNFSATRILVPDTLKELFPPMATATPSVASPLSSYVAGAAVLVNRLHRGISHEPNDKSFNKNRTRNGSFSSLSLSCRHSSLVSAQLDDLSPPPIDHDLLEAVTADGAKVSENGVIETFENDDFALDAFHNGVVVSNLSHFGRIRVSGDDRVQFLHNQSTANFECLREGQGCDTVFVTATARTIDIAYTWIMKNSILLVVSPVMCDTVAQMLNKYIFFADKVEIQDITKKTCFFTLMGPKSNHVMQFLNVGDLVGQPYGTHRHYSVNGIPITVGVGSLISEEGYSLLMSPAAAESVWKTILSQGAVPMGSDAWEKLRISQGRPAPGKELTNEFNVLEACLWNSISQDKGCYKGQETVARLITYDGVKQRLWGINLTTPAEPGTPITVDGKKVGKLTSCTSGTKGSEYHGLGYIKRQIVLEGSIVTVGDNIVGTLVEPPFLARQHPPSKT